RVRSVGFHEIVGNGAAVAVGGQPEAGAEAAQRAAGEDPQMTKPLPLHPLDRNVLPRQRHRTEPPFAEEPDRTALRRRTGPNRPSPKNRSDPSGCTASRIVCFGSPAASLKRPVSASAGQPAAGGCAKRHSIAWLWSFPMFRSRTLTCRIAMCTRSANFVAPILMHVLRRCFGGFLPRARCAQSVRRHDLRIVTPRARPLCRSLWPYLAPRTGSA